MWLCCVDWTLNGIAYVNVTSSLSLAKKWTRFNLYKFTKYYARLNVRKFVFTFSIFDKGYLNINQFITKLEALI